MALMADFGEMESYINLLNSKADEIKKIREKIEANFEFLRNSWSGEDYDIFYNNTSEYIKNIKNVETALRNHAIDVNNKKKSYQVAVDSYWEGEKWA